MWKRPTTHLYLCLLVLVASGGQPWTPLEWQRVLRWGADGVQEPENWLIRKTVVDALGKSCSGSNASEVGLDAAGSLSAVVANVVARLVLQGGCDKDHSPMEVAQRVTDGVKEALEEATAWASYSFSKGGLVGFESSIWDVLESGASFPELCVGCESWQYMDLQNRDCQDCSEGMTAPQGSRGHANCAKIELSVVADVDPEFSPCVAAEASDPFKIVGPPPWAPKTVSRVKLKDSWERAYAVQNIRQALAHLQYDGWLLLDLAGDSILADDSLGAPGEVETTDAAPLKVVLRNGTLLLNERSLTASSRVGGLDNDSLPPPDGPNRQPQVTTDIILDDVEVRGAGPARSSELETTWTTIRAAAEQGFVSTTPLRDTIVGLLHIEGKRSRLWLNNCKIAGGKAAALSATDGATVRSSCTSFSATSAAAGESDGPSGFSVVHAEDPGTDVQLAATEVRDGRYAGVVAEGGAKVEMAWGSSIGGSMAVSAAIVRNDHTRFEAKDCSFRGAKRINLAVADGARVQLTASRLAGGLYGVALFGRNTTATVTSCMFEGNPKTRHMWVDEANALVQACELAGGDVGLSVQNSAEAVVRRTQIHGPVNGLQLGKFAKLRMQDSRIRSCALNGVFVNQNGTELIAVDSEVAFSGDHNLVVGGGARAWLRGCEIHGSQLSGTKAYGSGSSLHLSRSRVFDNVGNSVLVEEGGATLITDSSELYGSRTKAGAFVIGEGTVLDMESGTTVHSNQEGNVHILMGAAGHFKDVRIHSTINSVGIGVKTAASLTMARSELYNTSGTCLAVESGSTVVLEDCILHGAVERSTLTVGGPGTKVTAMRTRLLTNRQLEVLSMYDNSFVALQRCEVSGSVGMGINIVGGAAAIVQDSVIHNNSLYNLFVSAGSNATVITSEIRGSKLGAGVYVAGQRALANITRSTLQNNAMHGVLVERQGACHISNSTVQGSPEAGLFVLSNQSRIDVQHCIIQGHGKAGVYVSESGRAHLQDCLLGGPGSPARQRLGAQATNVASYLEAVRCHFDGNTAAGVYLRGASARLKDCTFEGGEVGLKVLGSRNVTLQDCSVHGNTLQGMALDQGAMVTLDGTHVVDNGPSAAAMRSAGPGMALEGYGVVAWQSALAFSNATVQQNSHGSLFALECSCWQADTATVLRPSAQAVCGQARHMVAVCDDVTL